MATRYILLTLAFAIFTQQASSQNRVLSPNKRISLTFSSQPLRFSIHLDNRELVSLSSLDIIIGAGDSLITRAKRTFTSTKYVRESIISPVPEKRRQIPDEYNELTIEFNRPVRLVFRVYDDGVAYRFVTNFKDSIVVKNEIGRFDPGSNSKSYFTAAQKRTDADIFHTSFEENYTIARIDSIPDSTLIFTPTLVATPEAKIVITESDLEDYPGMFLAAKNNRELQPVFAGYPLAERITEGEFPQRVVTKRAEYIARTIGRRSFPWRVFAIAVEDKELPGNDLVYRLAAPSRVADHSFIKPGQSTEEWIIGINLFNVPFRSGINTATYKYYIDFAKKFGLERIMLDAGWSDYKDLFKVNPDLDMEEISRYARANGVGLSMWTLSMTLDRQLDSALDQFKRWGVDFIMTDFIDRDDQEVVRFHHRIAKACAEKKIMLMFHGSFKPAGFNRTYPNAVTREGVLGSEFNAWSSRPTPDHNLLLPFIRMLSGPMDYEPGLLDNGTKETFRPIWNKVMSMGTRCHQLAMFVVFESPVQMFSGNPSQGLLEEDYMSLLGSVPTVWDTTVILQGRLGEYIITARRSGTDWFIGGMTNWSGRELLIDCNFLPQQSYTATICEDGINADKHASDYRITTRTIGRADKLPMKFAPGGGFLLRLKPHVP